MKPSLTRSRWAAIGAAVAVTLGAGGIGLVSATSPDGAVTYVPIEPCRAADTRPGADNVGDKSSPIGPGETHMVNSNDGDCDGDVPATATGLQLNVTALNATEPSFITIWGSGDQPLASSLNPTPGQPPVPNAVTTGITGAGDFNMFNNAGSVDAVVDIVGFYTDHDHDDRYYTEDEVDTALDLKANSADVYTQDESNARFDNVDSAIDFESGSQPVPVADTVLASVTVDTPVSGYVTVTTGGFFLAGASDFIRCSITTGTTVDLTSSLNLDFETSDYRNASTTRVFAFNKQLFPLTPDETTYNFVCDNGGDTNAHDINMSAIFVPDPDAGGFIILPLDATESGVEDTDGG